MIGLRQLREKRNSERNSERLNAETYPAVPRTESTLSDPDSLELQASLPDAFAGLDEETVHSLSTHATRTETHLMEVRIVTSAEVWHGATENRPWNDGQIPNM